MVNYMCMVNFAIPYFSSTFVQFYVSGQIIFKYGSENLLLGYRMRAELSTCAVRI